jgi:AraC-like DNA-binding protein
MYLKYTTRLEGLLALTDERKAAEQLATEKGVYKFIWARDGDLSIEVDHQPITLHRNEVISLSHIQHLDLSETDGSYLLLAFNSNFYCIYGNDHEVSCSGFLFNGSAHQIRFALQENEHAILNGITSNLMHEFAVRDNLQEEMLRILLKRFIIECTRIARQRLDITHEKEHSFEVVRQFYNLVDQYFREKKQVQDYADLLHKSPKTLSNVFALCKLQSPLHVIHERTEAEAKRLLLYSNKSVKEIAYLLGFEDQATFSRFFRKMAGKSITEYKKEAIGNN